MIKNKIFEDRIQAMKDKNTIKRDVLTMVKAGIEKAEIEKRGPLTEEETQAIVSREIKQLNETIDTMKTPIQEVIDVCNAKIAILKAYLPEQLTEEQIEKAVQNTIMELGLNPMTITKSDLNQVRRVLMPQLKGKADGKTVSKIIDSFL